MPRDNDIVAKFTAQRIRINAAAAAHNASWLRRLPVTASPSGMTIVVKYRRSGCSPYSRRKIVADSALAPANEALGARRPNVMYFGQSLSAIGEAASRAIASSETRNHMRVPRGKSNLGPITPITECSSPSMRSDWPTMSLRLPNWDAQSVYERTTTGAFRSLPANTRPMSGRTRSTAKKFSVTDMALTDRASPLSPRSA